MQKLASLSTFLIMLLFLSSCGAKKDEKLQDKKITVTTVNIVGDGSSYLKVVPGEYTVKVADDKIVLPIKMEVVKKYQGSNKAEMGNLNLSPLDKTGIAIPDLGLPFMPASGTEWDKVKDLLGSDVGKQATISFQWNYFGDKKKQAQIMKEIEGFELGGADITGTEKQVRSVTSNDSNSDNTTLSTEGSANWDQLLTDYEKYIDDYVTFFKKSQEGDAAAMAQYPEMLASATKLQTSLAAAQKDNKLSPEQMTRLLKIQAKMTTAIAELQSK